MTTEPTTTEPPAERWRFTRDEFWALARSRFGEDWTRWAFQCRSCDDIATAADFLALNDNPDYTDHHTQRLDGTQAGWECIGNYLAAGGTKRPARGCNSKSYGLFRGPWIIVMPDGTEHPSFRLAPAPQATS